MKERSTEASHRVFRAVIAQKLPSFLITRVPPEKVRQAPGLAGVRVAWLSRAHAPEAYDPSALAPLSLAVEQFVEGNRGRGVILLEDLDSLIAENGFRGTILFVEHVSELIVQRKAIFLVSANPARLPEKEMAILERNLRILT